MVRVSTSPSHPLAQAPKVRKTTDSARETGAVKKAGLRLGWEVQQVHGTHTNAAVPMAADISRLSAPPHEWSCLDPCPLGERSSVLLLILETVWLLRDEKPVS